MDRELYDLIYANATRQVMGGLGLALANSTFFKSVPNLKDQDVKNINTAVLLAVKAGLAGRRVGESVVQSNTLNALLHHNDVAGILTFLNERGVKTEAMSCLEEGLKNPNLNEATRSALSWAAIEYVQSLSREAITRQIQFPDAQVATSSGIADGDTEPLTR